MKGTKIVFYIMYLSFVILLIWAFKLQVLETELHRTYLDSLRIVVRRIEAPRGRIMTEDGMVLAWDEETFFAKVVGSVEADAIEKILGKSRKLELIMGEEVPVTEAEALQLSKYGVMITA
ncbi:MAG: penicillin-binding protein, partial [Thermotogaceae bacterium]|nr:penicillin-binding protein [Thermotogaceae bacterium]